MSRKSIYFFTTPDDFTVTLKEIIAKLHLLVITLENDIPKELGFSNVLSLYSELANRNTTRIYLASSMPVLLNRNDFYNINFAKHGLIAVDVPSHASGTLYLGNVSVRTDWLDGESGIKYSNDDVSKLFNKIKASIIKKCTSGVIVRDRLSNAERLVKSIWISKSAVTCFENGNILCQRGVANAYFTPIKIY